MKKSILSIVGIMSIMTTLSLADDFKGSIKKGFFESEHTAIKKVTVPMIKAIQVAKSATSGQVVKAELEEEDGYIVYKIIILDSKGDEQKILVDPVTAKILKSEED